MTDSLYPVVVCIVPSSTIKASHVGMKLPNKYDLDFTIFSDLNMWCPQQYCLIVKNCTVTKSTDNSLKCLKDNRI